MCRNLVCDTLCLLFYGKLRAFSLKDYVRTNNLQFFWEVVTKATKFGADKFFLSYIIIWRYNSLWRITMERSNSFNRVNCICQSLPKTNTALLTIVSDQSHLSVFQVKLVVFLVSVWSHMSTDCLVIHVLFILKTILKKTVIKVLTTKSFVDDPWLTHLLNYIHTL